MECGSNNYDEQSGVAAQLEHKRKFLLAVRAMAGDDIHFLSLANLEAIRLGLADADVTI